MSLSFLIGRSNVALINSKGDKEVSIKQVGISNIQKLISRQLFNAIKSYLLQLIYIRNFYKCFNFVIVKQFNEENTDCRG